MRLRRVEDAEAYDAVLVSPHVGDATLACVARLLDERARGGRVLVVVVCGDPDGPPSDTGWTAALERASLDLLALGVPAAEDRDPGYRSLRAVAFDRRASDDDACAGLANSLLRLRQRTRARNVFLPLGVGGHADHRLALEASLGVFASGDGCNVFLYEERPAALLRSAVRLRLGQLGAWLPPGATALDGSGLSRLLWGLQRGSYVACSRSGWGERVRCTALLARQWRESRAWRPQRGLGLRVQPVLHAAGEASLPAVREAMRAWAARRGRVALTFERLERLAAKYSRRLGGAHVERYWLLLPPREEAQPGGRLGELTDRAVAS